MTGLPISHRYPLVVILYGNVCLFDSYLDLRLLSPALNRNCRFAFLLCCDIALPADLHSFSIGRFISDFRDTSDWLNSRFQLNFHPLLQREFLRKSRRKKRRQPFLVSTSLSSLLFCLFWSDRNFFLLIIKGSQH